MQKILIATKNKGKIIELTKFLSDLPLQIVSLSDMGIDDDVLETGTTYKENSQLKARFYTQISNLPTVADDGGLEIDALGGKPGVYSHRWIGHEATDDELINHMQKVSKSLPDNNRNALFKVVLTLALPNGKAWSVEGEVHGVIAKEPFKKALAGYPYRSFFYLPKLHKFYFESELTPDEMKRYNHRFIAAQKLIPLILRKLS